ncbi:uncharacterized protein LOC125757545 [Rhipicephalus sanguineus]|uniref:uncharacterized protein LOC125757545 n=1 Tax=Rhipicephalus sanguineus TaxID=34632 RepID=UPI0020C2AA8B|nr:uncharacterized protein LOC125757545 [Rhipicephalus sanguineus]
MADLIGKPPGFWNHPGTPTVPWTRWLEDFETYLLAAGGESFSAERKAALLKTLLGAEGQKQARVALAAASETPGSTKDAYCSLVQTLTAKFSPPEAVATARLSFRNLTQGESPPQDFLFELQDTANQCDFGELKDQMLLEQLLIGLTSTRLRERLLVEEATLTFEKAVKIINDADRVQRRLKEYEPEALVQLNTAPHESSAQRRPLPRVVTPSTEPRPWQLAAPSSTCQHYNRPPQSATGCPNCGYQRAPTQNCPARGKVCYQCSKRGHFATVCRSRPFARSPPAWHQQASSPSRPRRSDHAESMALSDTQPDLRTPGFYADVEATAFNAAAPAHSQFQ